MGLRSFLHRFTSEGARQSALASFYAVHPGWQSYQDQKQILGFFHAHPDWKLLDEAVLVELTSRLTKPPFHSVAYNYADGLFVLAMIADKYRVVETNFLPICRDKEGIDGGTPDGKLWLFALTLQRLSSRLLREADEMLASGADQQATSHRFEDSKCAAEACLTADPWFHTAYTLLPFPWVARTGDFDRAFAICDEGVRLCKYLSANRSSLACFLDQKMAEEALEAIPQIELVRERLLSMRI